MAESQQQHWANREADILGSTVPTCVLSTAILIWRVAYGIKSKRKLLLCDYLLILAQVSTCLVNHSHGISTDKTTTIGDEYRNDYLTLQNSRLRLGSTLPRPVDQNISIQLLSLDQPGHQYSRSSSAQVFYLRIPASAQVLENLRGYRLDLDFDGDSVQRHHTYDVAILVYALRSELEQRDERKVFSERNSGHTLHPGSS